MKLPNGHHIHVRRTKQPTKIYKILGPNKFEGTDGNIYSQQEVFGQSYARVDVIDPATNEITSY